VVKRKPSFTRKPAKRAPKPATVDQTDYVTDHAGYMSAAQRPSGW
jgi:hypothetical protein